MEEKYKVNLDGEEPFPFLRETGHVVSIVGAGGKTTLLFYLAQQFAARGYRTAVLTTTKIYKTTSFCETVEECRTCWDRGEYAICAKVVSTEKLGCPSFDTLRKVLAEAEAVVIEADGAAGKACKVPAAHEPVILPESDIVLGVLGMDVLGCTIEESCHRPASVAVFLDCQEQHRLTEADLAKIFLSEQGLYKGVESRTYYMVLNKCDDVKREEAGKRIQQLLRKQGRENVILTCFLEDKGVTG